MSPSLQASTRELEAEKNPRLNYVKLNPFLGNNVPLADQENFELSTIELELGTNFRSEFVSGSRPDRA